MAAATVASNRSPELYISRATIQLRLPQTVAPPRVYEWRTQVTTMPQADLQADRKELKETAIECIKQNSSTTTTAPTTASTTAKATGATPIYTPPRIKGDEAKRKNLPQTLGNFFEAERFSSAWNRVTK
ncbi:uncharacterized protein LOC117782311 [Drosophila innubila]|uniref:uncharacterized protein LOC117782311 n=1 Tax=Drosophila innubila TaxID=198719 RepID=UPI00148C6E87|nr:uncharacterized protein LOC117782311 [Drosophila innubila]